MLTTQLTEGHGAWEGRLIFLKSLYILLSAAPSPSYMRKVTHSTSKNVLNNVSFCCNFNFDVWFQEETLLNKKKEKHLGYFIAISIVFILLLSSNSTLIYSSFTSLNKTDVKGWWRRFIRTEFWKLKDKIVTVVVLTTFGPICADLV